jgi:hypothetical protein
MIDRTILEVMLNPPEADYGQPAHTNREHSAYQRENEASSTADVEDSGHADYSGRAS